MGKIPHLSANLSMPGSIIPGKHSFVCQSSCRYGSLLYLRQRQYVQDHPDRIRRLRFGNIIERIQYAAYQLAGGLHIQRQYIRSNDQPEHTGAGRWRGNNPGMPGRYSADAMHKPHLYHTRNKKFVYSANYTLPGTSPVWRFLFTGQMTGSLAGRALTITNIYSVPDTYIQLVDTLNNTVSHNTSPTLTNVPTPFFCINNNDNYNPGAIDPDGDSLTFFLVPGQSGSTTSTPYTGAMEFVSYMPPFTATAPLIVTTMAFDPATGQVAFYRTAYSGRWWYIT